MAAEWYKKGLERVAQEVDFHCTQDDAHTFPRSECRKHGECAALVGEVLVVLQSSALVRLLAAGQAMHDSNGMVGKEGWDAARKAFLEGCDES